MLASALLLCALGSAPHGTDVATVVAVLERYSEQDAARPAVEGRLAAELGKLGTPFLPDLFAVLAFGPGPERALERTEEAALAQALASFGTGPLRPFLRRRLGADAPGEERLAALYVLARVGTSDDVSLLRAAVQGFGPGLTDALQEACTGVLGRDPRALERLRRWMLEAPLESATALAHALGRSAGPPALSALASSLGFRTELDPELLAEIAPLAARAPKPLEEDVLEPIEDALQGSDEQVLRAAALALGHAQHLEALPRLVELLKHENRGVRAAAEWALEHGTGLRFGADGERWLAWLRAERAWLEKNGPRLRAELHARAAEVAIRALAELSCHRWRRHELALAAVVGLEHESPLVRRLACTALARIGSRAAAAGLRRALDDEDESVARAARQALEALGLDAPGTAAGTDTAIRSPSSRNAPARSTNRPKDA
jgi:HEAT repeat protein